LFLCFRVTVRVMVRVRVSEKMFNYVFGQTSIQASVLDPNNSFCVGVV